MAEQLAGRSETQQRTESVLLSPPPRSSDGLEQYVGVNSSALHLTRNYYRSTRSISSTLPPPSHLHRGSDRLWRRHIDDLHVLRFALVDDGAHISVLSLLTVRISATARYRQFLVESLPRYVERYHHGELTLNTRRETIQRPSSPGRFLELRPRPVTLRYHTVYPYSIHLPNNIRILRALRNGQSTTVQKFNLLTSFHS